MVHATSLSTHMATWLCVGFMGLVFFIPDGRASDAPAPVPYSGQTTSRGVAWPTPRFVDNGDGTVVDRLTGLHWMKNANCWGSMSWFVALSRVAQLNTGASHCDGYTGRHTDWRLPHINELESLVDTGRVNPVLPSGHAFSSVQSTNYWSSTTRASNTGSAWDVNLNGGNVNNASKAGSLYGWPVRGGP